MPMYGPTPSVREFSKEQLEAFERNKLIPHDHTFVGDEIVDVTHMVGEKDYFEHEWYCQVCGVTIRGETLSHAMQSIGIATEKDPWDTFATGIRRAAWM